MKHPRISRRCDRDRERWARYIFDAGAADFGSAPAGAGEAALFERAYASNGAAAEGPRKTAVSGTN
jgi:hypothetical protein